MEEQKASSLISSGYAVPVEVEAVESVKEPEAEPVEVPVEPAKQTPKRSRHKR